MIIRHQTHSRLQASRTAVVINLPHLCEKKVSLLSSESQLARGVELSEKARVAAEHRRGGEARAKPVKVEYQDDVTDEEEVMKKQAKPRFLIIL